MIYQVNDLFQAPNMVGNFRFHCRGDAQGLVNPAEVVVHEMEGDLVLVVFQLF
jgi:hypothetical protein